METFGPIIPRQLMTDINNAPFNKIFDESIYNLTQIPKYKSNGKDFVDFTNMAQKINDVNNKFYNASPGVIPNKQHTEWWTTTNNRNKWQ